MKGRSCVIHHNDTHVAIGDSEKVFLPVSRYNCTAGKMTTVTTKDEKSSTTTSFIRPVEFFYTPLCLMYFAAIRYIKMTIPAPLRPGFSRITFSALDFLERLLYAGYTYNPETFRLKSR